MKKWIMKLLSAPIIMYKYLMVPLVGKWRFIYTCTFIYRVVQKSGHPSSVSGVRFFGPPCVFASIAETKKMDKAKQQATVMYNTVHIFPGIYNQCTSSTKCREISGVVNNQLKNEQPQMRGAIPNHRRGQRGDGDAPRGRISPKFALLSLRI